MDDRVLIEMCHEIIQSNGHQPFSEARWGELGAKS
jgi:hypothetical protein